MPALTFATEVELTPLEVVVLDHLARALAAGWCPSREELSRAAGLGGRGYRINSVLERLDQMGYIAIAPGRSRAISLLRTADGRPFRSATIWVPLLGKLSAGFPPLAATSRNEEASVSDIPFGVVGGGDAIELTRGLLGVCGDVYALQVAGDSMSDALLDDGDIVILSEAAEAHNGDMVVARVADPDGSESTTLRYYYRENGHVRLQPAHPRLQPSLHRSGQVTVHGKVVLVIRRTD